LRIAKTPKKALKWDLSWATFEETFYSAIFQYVLKLSFADFAPIRLLEIGIGYGYFLKHVEVEGKNLIKADLHGIDIAIDLIRKARSVLNESSLILSDALFLPYKDEVFDIIVALEVIEHVADPISFLSDVKRVLKVKGFVFLTFPDAISWHPLYAFFKHFPSSVKKLNILTPFMPQDDPDRSRQPIDHAYTLKDIFNFASEVGLDLFAYTSLDEVEKSTGVELRAILGSVYTSLMRNVKFFGYRKLLLFQRYI